MRLLLDSESACIDQNKPTRQTAGPLSGAHRNWTFTMDPTAMDPRPLARTSLRTIGFNGLGREQASTTQPRTASANVRIFEHALLEPA
jgi:hypothetical protein